MTCKVYPLFALLLFLLKCSCLFSSLNLHSRLLQDEKNTYVIGLSKSFAGYTLYVTVLDSSSGKETVSYPVPGNLRTGLDDVLVVEHPTEPSLFWVENGSIKWLSLINRKVTTLKAKNVSRLIDLGIGEHGIFVAQEVDETSSVYSFYATETGFEPRQLFVFQDSVRSLFSLTIFPLLTVLTLGSLGQTITVYLYWWHRQGCITLHISCILLFCSQS